MVECHLIAPGKVTLVTVSWRPIVRAMLIEFSHHCSGVFLGILLKPLYRHFSQICHWGYGNEPQSQWGKAKTIGYQRMEYSVAFLPRSSLPAGMLVQIHILFQDIGRLQNHGKGISIWIICLKICVLSVWIPVCVHAKVCIWMINISWWFWSSKLRKNSEVAVQQKGKKYQYSWTWSCNNTIPSVPSYFSANSTLKWCITVWDFVHYFFDFQAKCTSDYTSIQSTSYCCHCCIGTIHLNGVNTTRRTVRNTSRFVANNSLENE